ncbi:MAG: CatB-related O-acetyltransferase [Rhodospirillales bacterium]
MSLPDPDGRHPLVFPDGRHDRATVFLRAVIDHPNIEVGAYSYYNDATLPEDYAKTLAPYLFPGAPERLKIGRFCQIAQGARFITASANHAMAGVSTYPFSVFDPTRIASYRASLPRGADTTVGHDCWIGREALLLPGATLGHGVIVGAGAVVAGEVPDFAIVAGNPARIIRKRFGEAEIARILKIAWWHWESDRIAAALPLIEGADIDRLEEVGANP